MAAGWQEAATRQAELLCGRVRELLSSGAALLRSELGLDLGLEPALWPTWVILSAALVVLLVLTVLLWAAACGLLPARGKRRAGRSAEELSPESADKSAALRSLKAEEPKKRSRKRPEKKSQPNGRAVAEVHEEAKEAEEVVQPATEIKTEKPKKKKKAKTEVNPTKTVTSTDGKEPDDGAWETKISNREKRQQRRKDKAASDDSGSPGGVDPPAASTAAATPSTPVEPPKSTAAAPVTQKKNKGEASRAKAAKGDAVTSQATASVTEAQAMNGRGWNDAPAKVPAPIATLERDNWTPLPKGAGRRNQEAPTWTQEVEGSWSILDGRMKKHELNPVTLNMLSITAAAESKPVSKLHDGPLKVDDEWSGLNGMATDPSSDWNAPSEVWGNYEEHQLDTPTPPEEVLPEAKGSDDDKEKGDSATAGSGKSKKKKKKKKKQGDDTGAALQVAEEPVKPKEPAAKEQVHRVQERTLPTKNPAAPPEQVKPERPAVAKKEKEKQTVSPKPAKQVPQRPAEQEAPAKQANPPPPSQKKPEENWESPKQVKKKKARRET
ncbi:protein LYRIC-like [Arapaima gigas]